MYNGEDRVSQVSAVYELASELSSAVTTSDLVGGKTEYGTVAALAQALADDWRDNPEAEVPAWYDEHDHRLLIERLVKVL